MDTKQLVSLREEINKLDEQLVRLLNDRAKLAVAVGKVKGDAPLYDPERELQVLRNVARLNAGPLSKGAIEDIFATIIGACRRIQTQKTTI